MAKKDSKDSVGSGYVFLVKQSTELACKSGDSPPQNSQYQFFKIAKSFDRDDKDGIQERDKKIASLKKGNPHILSLTNPKQFCTCNVKDPKNIKKQIKHKIGMISGMQQQPQLERGWFCYDSSVDPMPEIIQIFKSYN